MIYQAIFIALISMRVLLMKQAQMRYIAYWLTLAFLFLFSAFRWEVGCDWSGYLNQFEVQMDRSLSDALTGRDPLWWMMIDLLHRFGFAYEWSLRDLCGLTGDWLFGLSPDVVVVT